MACSTQESCNQKCSRDFYLLIFKLTVYGQCTRYTGVRQTLQLRTLSKCSYTTSSRILRVAISEQMCRSGASTLHYTKIQQMPPRSGKCDSLSPVPQSEHISESI